MKKIYKFINIMITIIFILAFTNQVFAKTDDELRASNEIEFFVTEEDGSWWSVTYPANKPVGNKYWYEIVDGVQRNGIRIDKVSEFRYQLVPETQEQKDLLIGYETINFDGESWQKVKLQSFLRDVDCPMSDERIKSEKEQAEQQQKCNILKKPTTE